MAVAGSVAPVFRDEGYVASATYDFYHAIIHNNKLYFCRQDGTIGHEPQEESDEYWFLSLDGNFGDAVTLNGKTESELEVADSAKLGGKGASEYVQGKNIKIVTDYPSGITYESTMKELINALPNGSIFMQTAHAPIVPKDYCSLLVYRYNENYAFGYAICQLDENEFFGRLNGNAQWGGWFENATTADLANYLPLSGGTLSGNLHMLNYAESAYVRIIMANLARQIYLAVEANGTAILYDSNNKKAIIHSTADGTTTFNGTATGNLPLSGGTLTGLLTLPSMIVNGTGSAPVNIINTSALNSFIEFLGNNGTSNARIGLLGMNGVNTPTFRSTSGTNYTLLHSGNVGDYAVPITGGVIGDGKDHYPLVVKGNNGSRKAWIGFRDDTDLGFLGMTGVNNPVFTKNDLVTSYPLHHDGNSAKVAIQSTAPSDTSALWYDTVNKVCKRYVDGAWQA